MPPHTIRDLIVAANDRLRNQTSGAERGKADAAPTIPSVFLDNILCGEQRAEGVLTIGGGWHDALSAPGQPAMETLRPDEVPARGYELTSPPFRRKERHS